LPLIFEADMLGCSTTAEVQITVVNEEIVIPDAISPNNDVVL